MTYSNSLTNDLLPAPTEKRPYVAPVVKVWGDIEDLTQGDVGATYDTPALNSKTV